MSSLSDLFGDNQYITALGTYNSPQVQQQPQYNNNGNDNKFNMFNYNNNRNNQNNYQQPMMPMNNFPLQKGYNHLGDLTTNEEGVLVPVVENGDSSYINSYTSILSEYDNIKNAIKDDIDGFRGYIKTLSNGNSKGKHQNLINAHSAMSSLYSTLISTVKDQQSIVTSSHKLDLTRSKELAKQGLDDNGVAMDFGSALATVMNSMNTFRRETGYNPAYDVVSPQQGGIITESPYTPILPSDKPQIVLMYDHNTGSAVFQAFNSSGEIISNYPDLPSEDFLKDMLIDPHKDTAKHKYTGLEFPLLVTNISNMNGNLDEEVNSLSDI